MKHSDQFSKLATVPNLISPVQIYVTHELAAKTNAVFLHLYACE